MHILDATTDKPMYTIGAKRTNAYPSPGSYVAISASTIKAFANELNITLAKEGTFAQTLVTTTTDAAFNMKKIIAPCIEENNAHKSEDFKVILKVESIDTESIKNEIHIELVSPFLNMPENAKFIVSEDDVEVVELWACTKESKVFFDKEAAENAEDALYYQRKDQQWSCFDMLCQLPEEISNWISTNCIKEFSKIFDLNGEIGRILELPEELEKANDHVIEFITDLQDDEDAVKNSINVIDLRLQESSNLTNENVYETNAVINHPLYAYTSNLMSSIFVNIEQECGIQLSEEKLVSLMNAAYKTMFDTTISIE